MALSLMKRTVANFWYYKCSDKEAFGIVKTSTFLSTAYDVSIDSVMPLFYAHFSLRKSILYKRSNILIRTWKI